MIYASVGEQKTCTTAEEGVTFQTGKGCSYGWTFGSECLMTCTDGDANCVTASDCGCNGTATLNLTGYPDVDFSACGSLATGDTCELTCLSGNNPGVNRTC